MYHEWYGLRRREKSGWGEGGNDAVFANIICQASTIRLEVRRYCAGWTCNSMNKFGVRRSCLWFMVFNDFFCCKARVVFPLTCQPDGHFWLGHPCLLSPIHLSRCHDKVPIFLQEVQPHHPSRQICYLHRTFRYREKGGHWSQNLLRVGGVTRPWLIEGLGEKQWLVWLWEEHIFSLVSLKTFTIWWTMGNEVSHDFDIWTVQIEARIFCVNFVMVRLTSKQLTLHLQGLDCSKLQGQCQSCEIEKWIRQLYCRVVKQINRIPTIVPEKCRKDGRHLALLCEMTRGRNLSMINRNDSQSCFSFQDPPGGWPGSGTSAWILTNKCPWNLSILPKFCFFLTWNVVLHLPALGGSDGTELLWKF